MLKLKIKIKKVNLYKLEIVLRMSENLNSSLIFQWEKTANDKLRA